MSRPQLLAAACFAGIALTTASCGSDDDGSPPAKAGREVAEQPAAAKTTPYDGLYEMRLSPAAARKVPDPSIRTGSYRLLVEKGRYSIVSPENGPYGGGAVSASGDQLRFGGDEGERCGATARYDVTRTSKSLTLRAVSDGCEGRKAFLDGRTWRSAES